MKSLLCQSVSRATLLHGSRVKYPAARDEKNSKARDPGTMCAIFRQMISICYGDIGVDARMSPCHNGARVPARYGAVGNASRSQQHSGLRPWEQQHEDLRSLMTRRRWFSVLPAPPRRSSHAKSCTQSSAAAFKKCVASKRARRPVQRVARQPAPAHRLSRAEWVAAAKAHPQKIQQASGPASEGFC